MFKLKGAGEKDGTQVANSEANTASQSQQGNGKKAAFTLGKTSNTSKPAADSANTGTDGAAKPSGLLLATAKSTKPAGLAAALRNTSKGTNAGTAPKSGLATALANEKPAIKSSGVAPLALQNEKYVLTAEASEQLPQDVLEAFATKMQYLITAMDSQDLQNAMYAVLKYTQEHPHLKDILRANDVGLMVKACRKSYGMTVVAKTSNKRKATNKSALDKDILDSLADLEINL